MYRVLRPQGYYVLVLGDVEIDGKNPRTAEILGELAKQETNGGFKINTFFDDIIPDDRRSRRGTRTTKYERILVMHKK
jgi:hypothetical protein